VSEVPAVLSEECANLSEGPAVLSEECANLSKGPAVLSEECANLSEGPAVLSEECVNLSEGRAVLSEECASLSEGQAVLSEECANLSEGPAVLSEECASLSKGPAVLSEECANQSEESEDFPQVGSDAVLAFRKTGMPCASHRNRPRNASVGGLGGARFRSPDALRDHAPMFPGSPVSRSTGHPRRIASMKARSHTPVSGEHTKVPRPGFRSTVFK
jgi:ribosomal protein S17